MQQLRNYDVMNESTANTGGAIPIFKMIATEDRAAALETGKPVFIEIEHVEIRIPGDPKNIITAKVTDQHRERWPEQYEKWKKTQENTVNGTPLEQWPLLNTAQVMQLKVSQIYTVEQLADLSDTAKQNYGMGISELQTKAKAFLAHAKDTAYAQKIAVQLEDANERIALLEKQIVDIGKINKRDKTKK